MNALLANVMVGYGGRTGWTAPEWVHRIPAGTAAKVVAAAAAPVIGLVFVVAFPIVGIAILAWMGAGRAIRLAAPVGRFLMNVGLFLAAPVIGLAYAVAFPFMGIGMLVARATRRAT